MILADKRVFVTGATGFLGGYVCQRLGAEGAIITALAHRKNRDRYIRDVPGIQIVFDDIINPRNLVDLVQGSDILFHIAAATRGTKQRQIETNINGTRNVLDAAISAGIRRLVHVSSIAVYGYRNLDDLTEESPYDSSAADPYHYTKAEGERLVLEAAARGEIEASVLRPGMIYGSRSNLWTRRAFQVAKRNPTIWIGKGSGAAYPIYVDDVVDLMMILATHLNAVGEAFNCTPDPSPTWLEYLGAYATLVNNDRWWGIPIPFVRPIAYLAAWLAPRHSQINDLPAILRLIDTYRTIKMDKTRQLLGWEPETNLEDGVRRCIPYLQEKGLLTAK